mmetsp:Transcript_6784/g.10922  ORF Transcript_6784/g.10922 Transcript_6784/m.10922 type:complete len:87 (+) Transcript_6784:1157-1417(+)
MKNQIFQAKQRAGKRLIASILLRESERLLRISFVKLQANMTQHAIAEAEHKHKFEIEGLLKASETRQALGEGLMKLEHAFSTQLLK